jgi:hypothetical protein
MTVFVLVHGPLTGPAVWSGVATELGLRGVAASVPSLWAGPESASWWKQHTTAVVTEARRMAAVDRLVLVGHSGAGPLLPLIADELGYVAACIYVDAELPRDGCARVELFASPAAAEAFKARAVDGVIPPWTDAELRDEIPDEQTRSRLLAELRPVPLAVYEEPIPVPVSVIRTPGAYVQFGDAYEAVADRARAITWPVVRLEGGHFLLLSDPRAVAHALIELDGRLGPG